MSPRFAINDLLNAVIAHAHLSRELAMGDAAACIPGTNFTHFVSGEFRAPRLLSLRQESEVQGVKSVLFGCAIFQVFRSIVGLVGIYVVYALPFGAWADKCGGNELVNSGSSYCPANAQQNSRVPFLGYSTFQDALSLTCAPIAVVAPDAPKAGHAVNALATHYGTPFFCRGKLIVSHAVKAPTLMVLVRLVRGVLPPRSSRFIIPQIINFIGLYLGFRAHENIVQTKGAGGGQRATLTTALAMT